MSGRSRTVTSRERRLRLQRKRLVRLARVADDIIESLVEDTQRWLADGGMADIYAAGAQVATDIPFSFTAPHRAAVNVLAQDTFADVLVATEHVSDDVKAFVRTAGRQLAGFKLTGGETAVGEGRRFARELEKELVDRGIGKIVYANGSRHSFGEYAEMLLRTKTGVAYNMGTLNQGRAVGVEFWEILDGSLCGLTEHNDPQLANGLIVRTEIAAAWPLAHPNCRRALNPRPDLTADTLDSARSLVAPESRADQTAWEEELRKQGEGRRRRKAAKERRARRPKSARTAKTRAPKRRGGTGSSGPTGRTLGWLNADDDATWPSYHGRTAVDDLGGSNRVVRVDRGPGCQTVRGRPGPGVALVDDNGRLYFSEAFGKERFSTYTDAGPTARTLAGDVDWAGAEKRLETLMDEWSRALPDGFRGPQTVMSVTSRSTQDDRLGKQYGRTFLTAANVNDRRAVHFNGKVSPSDIWHEAGHSFILEANERMEGIIKSIDDGMWAPPADQERLLRSLWGMKSSGGHGWSTAAQADADRLATHPLGTYRLSFIEDTTGLNNGLKLNGWGRFGNRPMVPAVTDYGASNPRVEDVAEAYRLLIDSNRTGRIGYIPGTEQPSTSLMGTSSFRKQYPELAPVSPGPVDVLFKDLYPNRAAYFDDLADALDIELPL